MKKLDKIKLKALSEANLLEREMYRLTGGDRLCQCSCYYADISPSSVNMNANYNIGNNGGYSTEGCRQYVTAAGTGTGVYCGLCTAGYYAFPPY